jgi:uncharacterized protein YciI
MAEEGPRMDDPRRHLPVLRRRPTRDALRTQHRDYLRGLADQGLLLVSGPVGPDDPAGALLLFRTDGRNHVNTLVQKDPFTPSGVIASTEIAEWVSLLHDIESPTTQPGRSTAPA